MPDPDDLVSDLVDLSDADLSDLNLDDSALGATLRILRDEIDRPDEAVSGFNSSL